MCARKSKLHDWKELCYGEVKSVVHSDFTVTLYSDENVGYDFDAIGPFPHTLCPSFTTGASI